MASEHVDQVSDVDGDDTRIALFATAVSRRRRVRIEVGIKTCTGLSSPASHLADETASKKS